MCTRLCGSHSLVMRFLLPVAVILGLSLGPASGYYTAEELKLRANGGFGIVHPTQGEPWPKPQLRHDYGGYMILRPAVFQFKVVGTDCKFLRDVIMRYYKMIVSSGKSVSHVTDWYKPWKKDPKFQGYLDIVRVHMMGKCDTWPVFNMDEHYEIKINNPDVPGGGIVTSETIWGIMRGLETFTQLLYPAPDAVGLKIPSTLIEDFPRFPHRGLMLDTSRHFLPINSILETIDLMSMNKYNVFHWHIVDDQSFPYQSAAFPNLSTKGAYDPKTHIYSRKDIGNVIEFARVRGIRVIPEFDTPGHTQSWGPGQPGLLTPCYQKGKPDGTYGPVDPINEDNYKFLDKFFEEVNEVFPDNYIHLGGDEVDFSCWKSNPDIKKFMMSHNYSDDYSLLEQYYMQGLVDIVAENNNSYIIWQEVIDNKVQVNEKTIVHVWKGDYYEEMDKVTSLGYHALLSSCWYLNEISYGIDWHPYYKCDPQHFNGSEEQLSLVMGGEACMWGEFVDGTNLCSRLWPRASVVAERLWSSEVTTDLQDAETRLEEHRCRLLKRGFPVEPANGPGFCPVEWAA